MSLYVHLACRAERIELIRSVAKDIPRSDGNPANLGSLRNTTTQMLEDMESQDIIIDRSASGLHLPPLSPHNPLLVQAVDQQPAFLPLTSFRALRCFAFVVYTPLSIPLLAFVGNETS